MCTKYIKITDRQLNSMDTRLLQENYFGGCLSSLEERENEKFAEGNRSGNTCLDSLTSRKSSSRLEFGRILFL